MRGRRESAAQSNREMDTGKISVPDPHRFKIGSAQEGSREQFRRGERLKEVEVRTEEKPERGGQVKIKDTDPGVVSDRTRRGGIAPVAV